MKEKGKSGIDAGMRVLVLVGYAVQLVHCVVPALILHDMMADVQTAGAVKNLASRLFTLAISAGFFVLIARGRDAMLGDKGNGSR